MQRFACKSVMPEHIGTLEWEANPPRSKCQSKNLLWLVQQQDSKWKVSNLLGRQQLPVVKNRMDTDVTLTSCGFGDDAPSMESIGQRFRFQKQLRMTVLDRCIDFYPFSLQYRSRSQWEFLLWRTGTRKFLRCDHYGLWSHGRIVRAHNSPLCSKRTTKNKYRVPQNINLSKPAT